MLHTQGTKSDDMFFSMIHKYGYYVRIQHETKSSDNKQINFKQPKRPLSSKRQLNRMLYHYDNVIMITEFLCVCVTISSCNIRKGDIFTKPQNKNIKKSYQKSSIVLFGILRCPHFVYTIKKNLIFQTWLQITKIYYSSYQVTTKR